MSFWNPIIIYKFQIIFFTKLVGYEVKIFLYLFLFMFKEGKYYNRNVFLNSFNDALSNAEVI
jgi:hypothetical protein